MSLSVSRSGSPVVRIRRSDPGDGFDHNESHDECHRERAGTCRLAPRGAERCTARSTAIEGTRCLDLGGDSRAGFGGRHQRDVDGRPRTSRGCLEGLDLPTLAVEGVARHRCIAVGDGFVRHRRHRRRRRRPAGHPRRPGGALFVEGTHERRASAPDRGRHARPRAARRTRGVHPAPPGTDPSEPRTWCHPRSRSRRMRTSTP